MVNGILIPCNGEASIEVVELRSLDDYQVAVNGWIEPFDLPSLGVTVYVNESARREHEPLNSRATLLCWSYQPTRRYRAMLYGDVVVAGLLGDDNPEGEVPSGVRDRLLDLESYTVQVRPIGGSIWHDMRATYRDYFDAVLWGIVFAERWRGTDEVRVVRVRRGTLQGPTGERVLVSQELLEKISFIREGEFKEVEGAPTLRLIGDVVPTNTINLGTERIVMHAITTEDVISYFLDLSPGIEPREYIRQAAAGSTSFVPVHFYRVAAEMTTAQLIDFVSDVNTRSQAKSKLLGRLRSTDAMRTTTPSLSQQHPSTVLRRGYYDSLLAGELPSLPFASQIEAKSFMDAIRALDDSLIVELHDQLLAVLKGCFESHYESAGSVADSLRRAACRIDAALYGAN